MAKRPRSHALIRRLGLVEALDPPAQRISGVIRRVLPAGPVKDALSGTWLGHALHPLLTDVPIGTWTSALILDLTGGRQSQPAAERLIAVGLGAALPTFVSGWSEWSDSMASNAEVRRVGVVHALSNGSAAALFAGSLVARKRGRPGAGRALALVAAGGLGVGGWLGGHLSYADGVGVDHTAFEDGPSEWTPVLREADLADGATASGEAGGVAVVLARQGGEVRALADTCCHRGGPLHKGELGDGTVTCPWHGSVFSLEDGSVVRGPAAYPQPAFDVRSSDGMIEVRARRPG